MHHSLVIIPTYNESENIEKIIKAVMKLPLNMHILVVDDNSPDKTGDIVAALQETFPQVFLLRREEKNGLGAAYIAGFKWALQNNYDLIFEMDADFSHDPKYLLNLYNTCTNDSAQVAIGSRYKNGINVINWPLKRILLSYGASWYVRFITGMPITDPTAGFICYKKSVLQAINLDAIKFVGYAFQIEMKYKAYLMKFNLKEVPIIFTDRVEGVSKMNSSIIYEAIVGVIKMKLSCIFNKKAYLS